MLALVSGKKKLIRYIFKDISDSGTKFSTQIGFNVLSILRFGASDGSHDNCHVTAFSSK